MRDKRLNDGDGGVASGLGRCLGFVDDDQPGAYKVRVQARDGSKETAIEMLGWLETLGVKQEMVRWIDERSFFVWVDDREVGTLIHSAVVERYGALPAPPARRDHDHEERHARYLRRSEVSE